MSPALRTAIASLRKVGRPDLADDLATPEAPPYVIGRLRRSASVAAQYLTHERDPVVRAALWDALRDLAIAGAEAEASGEAKRNGVSP